jgi:hypothetical protein
MAEVTNRMPDTSHLAGVRGRFCDGNPVLRAGLGVGLVRGIRDEVLCRASRLGSKTWDLTSEVVMSRPPLITKDTRVAELLRDYPENRRAP